MTTAVMPDTGNVAGELALDRLAPDHWPNPRGPVDTTSSAFAELKASIAEQGILEPIVIGPPLLELDGCHAIIAGWRRFTAARELGLPSVPVHQKIAITDARAALRAALAENLARESMTPLAEASAIARLIELGDTQVQAAAAVGVSERTARERLRLLDLPKPVRDGIEAGKIPTTCTRQLQLVADVSPAAATAIAKSIATGRTRALDVIDPDKLSRVLDSVKTPGLVSLGYRQIKDLGLPPATARDLKARLKKAKGHDDGGYINLSTSAMGRKLLGEASKAGKLLRVEASHGGVSHYVAGAEWIERAATAVVEAAERSAAQAAAERKRQNAKAAKSEAQDPAARAEAERRAAERALDARAQPYAAAMNAELGERLRALRSCAIEGPVAQFVLDLVTSYSNTAQVAVYGYKHVDPARGDFPEGWWRAGDPGEAAAELLKAYVAAQFCDTRSDNSKARTRCPLVVEVERIEILRAAADHLNLLPDRARRLADARAKYEAEARYHDLRGTRRRILFELDKAPKAGLEHEPLRLAAKEWGRDAGKLIDVTVQVWSPADFADALEQLQQAGHVKATETKTKDAAVTRYTATAAGRKALLQPQPQPPPLLEDIDADAPPPLPDGTPATDELQDDDDLMSKLAPGSRRTTVLELVAAQPGITIPELAERMGLKQNGLYRLLPELADDGLVLKLGRGWHPAAAEASS